MPLYMDIHTVDSDSFSVEDVVKAHMEDLAVQEKFGVTQLKYWVNEGSKTLFCLMKGPDSEACHKVHEESHGNTACNIIEVSDNEYNLFMGVGTEVKDLAKTHKGELDTGYRTILLANIFSFSNNKEEINKKIILLAKRYEGVIILEPINEVMISFIYASEAIKWAKEIYEVFNSQGNSIEFNLTISSGRPVDEEGDSFFKDTKARVRSLCSIGLNNKMFIDEESRNLSEKEGYPDDGSNKFKIIKKEDFALLSSLVEILEDHLIESEFTSDKLTKLLGLSKSQAYRKLKGITGFSPNQLLQESRLLIALNKLGNKSATIAEIAYESGFSSPTYFTRLFKRRFGFLPTEYIALN